MYTSDGSGSWKRPRSIFLISVNFWPKACLKAEVDNVLLLHFFLSTNQNQHGIDPSDTTTCGAKAWCALACSSVSDTTVVQCQTHIHSPGATKRWCTKCEQTNKETIESNWNYLPSFTFAFLADCDVISWRIFNRFKQPKLKDFGNHNKLLKCNKKTYNILIQHFL